MRASKKGEKEHVKSQIERTKWRLFFIINDYLFRDKYNKFSHNKKIYFIYLL